MSALLTSLPGDIPGLLRHGSPVLWGDEPCLVQCSLDGAYQRVDGDVGGTPDPSELKLDLTDETGRSHAARWAMDHWRRMSSPQGALTYAEQRRCRDALDYRDMDRTELDELALLVLRLAGRAS